MQRKRLLCESCKAENLILKKGANELDHSHAPNLEEVSALKVIRNIKRKAEENPEAVPSQILRYTERIPLVKITNLLVKITSDTSAVWI